MQRQRQEGPKEEAWYILFWRKNRPSARAIEGEEEEVPAYETENQENEEEASEQPFDPFEPQEEEEQTYQEEQSEPVEPTVKMIIATMQNYVLESQAERKALASIKALKNDETAYLCRFDRTKFRRLYVKVGFY